MRLFSNRNRPIHLGPYPQELLRRVDRSVVGDTDLPPSSGGALEHALAPVRAVYEQLMTGGKAVGAAPVSESPEERTNLLKSAAYFFDAAIVGACECNDRWALVIAVEPGPLPEPHNAAAGWISGSETDFLNVRAAEIAMVVAGYVRALGYDADGINATSRASELTALAERAGVLVQAHGVLANPFLGALLGLAAVITDLTLEPDRPLDPDAGGPLRQCGLVWLLGTRGTRSMLERWSLGRRASHMSRYPMERIRRVPDPTTRVDEAEIPQVPLRASFFNRAARGDLGPKSQAQYPNFIMKEPLAGATRTAQGAMVPLQEGPAAERTTALDDTEANARAVKSLGYFLGTDLIGICDVPTYAWYTHDGRCEPITKHHRHAVVLLIDQGFETMEGASGDDWISGSQSMRAYLRGMEIATIMAAHLRSLGYDARAHSNTDGQVLQIPLILKAGLGELSRIGEVVLNPFVGPRFKSAVVTTDLPLAVDQHIDFGLQDMCEKCRKCARECPCNAISWGDKVMFNGYEMWKPDVERCTRYRLTNARGSACGRCMKTCPYNHEGLLIHRAFLAMAVHVPASRRWIATLDDRMGYGTRNPVKKWWQDLEIVDGIAGPPRAGANQRDLGLDKTDPKVPIAYYNADVMPHGDRADPLPVNRKAAIDAVRILETPEEAARRIAASGPTPNHYQPPEQDR
jgi:reductive dehalogenase